MCKKRLCVAADGEKPFKPVKFIDAKISDLVIF